MAHFQTGSLQVRSSTPSGTEQYGYGTGTAPPMAWYGMGMAQVQRPLKGAVRYGYST